MFKINGTTFTKENIKEATKTLQNLPQNCRRESIKKIVSVDLYEKVLEISKEIQFPWSELLKIVSNKKLIMCVCGKEIIKTFDYRKKTPKECDQGFRCTENVKNIFLKRLNTFIANSNK